MIDLDRISKALESQASSIESLLSLTKAKHEAEALAQAAKKDAEAALAPLTDSVNQVLNWIESSSAKIQSEIAALQGQAAVAEAVTAPANTDTNAASAA